MADDVQVAKRRLDASENEALIAMAQMGADAFGYTAELRIDRHLAQLLRLRVSQLNNCTYCLNLHYEAAREAGIPLSDEAQRYYRSGKPLLQRFLPFWVANFIERMTVLVLPLVAVLIPAVKLAPTIYRWRVHSRIVRWYGETFFARTSQGILEGGARKELLPGLVAGALLNLKPVIRVDADGKYTTVTTARTLTKSINAIADHLHHRYTHTPVWVTVLHGRFAEKADILANELKTRLNIAKLEVNRISPVLGVHTGPGIVGAAVVPMELMEDLVK